MKTFKILPDTMFAETFLTALFQKGANVHWPRTHVRLADVLRDQPLDRRNAAEYALEDFHAAGIKLTKLSENIEKALQLLSQ